MLHQPLEHQVSITSEEKEVLTSLFIDTDTFTKSPMTATTVATEDTTFPKTPSTADADTYFDHRILNSPKSIDSTDSQSLTEKLDKYHITRKGSSSFEERFSEANSFSYEEDNEDKDKYRTPPPLSPLAQTTPKSELLKGPPSLPNYLPPLGKVKRGKNKSPTSQTQGMKNRMDNKKSLSQPSIPRPSLITGKVKYKSTGTISLEPRIDTVSDPKKKKKKKSKYKYKTRGSSAKESETDVINDINTNEKKMSKVKEKSIGEPKTVDIIDRNKNKKNTLICHSEIHDALWLARGQDFIPSTMKSVLQEVKKKTRSLMSEHQADIKVNMKKKKGWHEIHAQDVVGDLGNDVPQNFMSAFFMNNKDSNHTDAIDIRNDKNLSHSRARSDSKLSSLDDEYSCDKRYNCWQLFRDECALDYGFAARTENDMMGTNGLPETRDSFGEDDLDDDSVDLRQFKILGTGVDDLSAQPHVLSPPLMDSLLDFVPDAHKFENFWLKFSLVRDGSCLDTFRQYTRASSTTVLAIQTTKGDVFGSFTTSPWENHGSECFGNGESFVWKMRMNRDTEYDQAHLESEIDVYPYSGFNSTIQVCTNNMIALGGTEIEVSSPLGISYQDYQKDYTKERLLHQEAGYAIALHDDLSHGTTAPCPTFCSPSLLGDSGEFFEVQNLEVWTFTPLETVDEAQKLEMRKYFILHQNTRTMSTSSAPDFAAVDLSQKGFYRRLGDKR